MRRFILFGAIVVGATLALAACGGSQTSERSTKPAQTPAVPVHLSDQQLMQNTVRDFLQAEINGDGATACSKLTPTVQQQTARQFKYPTCAAAYNAVGSAIAQTFTPAQKQAYANPTFGGYEVQGNTGDVAYTDMNGNIQRVTLNRDTGSWLIVNLT